MSSSIDISVDRVYNVTSESSSGSARKRPNKTQFLVDRLWPRGVKKETLHLGPDGNDDGWLKELTPSDDLRDRFHKGSLGFDKFSEHYRKELDENKKDGELDDALELIRTCSDDEIVLLTANKDEEQNHALVLQQWLEKQLS